MPSNDIKKTKLVPKKISNQLLLAASLIIASAVIASIVIASNNNQPTKKTVTINSNKIVVELATNEQTREQGLSGRASLAEGQGLLMVFEDSANWKIWMKDMQFPIDIVWINNERKVVGLKETAQPSSYPEIFSVSEKSSFILELPAGTIEKFNIQIGSEVKNI